MNPSYTRLRRTPPERSGPIRNSISGANARFAPRPESLPGAALRGALECGVQTAYAVIDEYMKRGYDAARHNNLNGNGQGNVNQDKPNYPNMFNVWGPMTPLMEQWSRAMQAWAEAWTAFIPGARGGTGPFPWQGFMAGAPAYPSTPATSSVSVEVSSPRPTEVTVNLKPGAENTAVSADSFQPAFPGQVSITRKSGRIGVSVSAGDPAPGKYVGVLRAADGTIAGDLTIVISGAPAAPNSR